MYFLFGNELRFSGNPCIAQNKNKLDTNDSLETNIMPQSYAMI